MISSSPGKDQMLVFGIKKKEKNLRVRDLALRLGLELMLGLGLELGLG